jgi:enoyl-CoA hydratase/carnithine racemase
MADEILFALKDGIATITIDRPEKRNALNTVLLEGFNSILSHVEESKEARVVVIRGMGKAFCSGIDLRNSAPGKRLG